MREERLVQWWFSLPAGSRLKTVAGETIHLLEHGERNRHDGPDVCGTVLVSSEGLLKGDVEFHLREREWNYHGHHTNPRYRNVILHVIMTVDASRCKNADGRAVSAVVVPEVTVRKLSPNTCPLEGEISSETVLTELWPLAIIRWQEKVSATRETAKKCGGFRQAFYESTFWALGLKGNEESFLRLSQLSPLSELESLGDVERIRERLLHVSGLRTADSQNGNSFIWRRCGIRPAAHPEKRVEFGAAVADKLLTGWAPWSDPEHGTFPDLFRLFGKVLLGRSWCCEWIGNVIVPFQAAWQKNSAGKVNELIEKWWTLKSGQSYGKLDRQFLGHLSTRLLKSFGVQQGLLALQLRYCDEKLCELCPLREG